MPDDRFVPIPWGNEKIQEAFVNRRCRYVKDGDPITMELMPGRITIWHDEKHHITTTSVEPGGHPPFPLPEAEVDRVLKGRLCRYVKNGDMVTADIVPGRVTIWHENSRITQIQIDKDLPQQ